MDGQGEANSEQLAYLEHLWAEHGDEDEEPPILAASETLRQHHDRPTYHSLAHANPVVSTLVPPATVTRRAANSLGGTGGGTAGRTAGGTTVLPAVELQQQLDGVIRACEQNQAAYERALLESQKATDLVKSMENELRSLEDEEEELSARAPVPADRLRRVRQWALERGASLEAQRVVSERKALALVHAEAALRQAEGELDFLADDRQDLSQTQALHQDQQAAVAAALREKELKAAEGYRRRQEAGQARRAAAEEEEEQQRQRVIELAEAGKEKAEQRLADKMAKATAAKGKAVAAIGAENAKRRDVVMELKADLEASRKEVAQKASLYRQLQKQKKEMQEAEFLALEEAGLNPYEVYRRRDIDKEMERNKVAIRKKIASRQESIAVQLAEEEAMLQRRQLAKEYEREMQRKFVRDMGPSAAEEKTEKYMQRTAGVSMLDPTGRLPFEPSNVATFKTPAFGMGQADDRLLAKITRRHPDAGPANLLMPATLRTAHEHQQALGATAKRPATADDADDGDQGTGVPDYEADDWLGDDAPPRSPDGNDNGPSERDAAYGGGGEEAGKGAASGGGGGVGWKELKTRPLTKFESQALAKSKVRHKQNIGATKVMMGKEFGGDAFMSSPPVALFDDFEVGHTYKVKLSVINRSYAKNTFRVLEVPLEYGNVIEHSYKLPGFLAPGVSSDVVITFTPRTNEDIETELKLLADTGPFQIPIRCVTKKAKPSLSTALLDFGSGVTLGESTSRTFVVSNDGALEVEYVIQEDSSGAEAFPTATTTAPTRGAKVEDDTRLEAQGFSISAVRGTVAGYGKSTVTVTFKPTLAEPSSLQLRVFFRASTQRKLFIPPASLRLRAVGRDVAVFAENTVVDLRCCMVGHTYRDFLPVRNTGKTAMKLALVPRHDIGDSWDVTPDFGFVQANDVFKVAVMFKPRVDTAEQLAKFAVPGAAQGTVEIPMKLSIPDQKLPVLFTIRAQITTSDLVFDPPALDFGSCIMNESTGVTLRVSNASALPQTFAFLDMHQGVHMSPNDGFGYLLPSETVERTVTLQPPIPGLQTFALSCKTLAGRTFSLPCSAVGVQSAVTLSHNKIRLAATAIGDQKSVSVVLRNGSDRAQAFEFHVPPEADLTFSPHVGSVAPQSSTVVQIDYAPRKAEAGECGFPQPHDAEVEHPASSTAPSTGDGAAAAAAAGEDVQRETEDGGADYDPNEWYRWRQWNLTCHLQPPANDGPGTGAAAATAGVQQLHLQVQTCAVQPDLVVVSQLPFNEAKHCYELDFGPIPVGQRVIRKIELYNQGERGAQVRTDPLDPVDTFTLVNSARLVLPGRLFKQIVSFTPPGKADYLEFLYLRSPRTQVCVALKGQGIAPELKVLPDDLPAKGLDFGDVPSGETRELRFSVVNTCPFTLTFSMQLGGLVDPNLTMRPAFFCKPERGTLAQGETQEVVVVFRPCNQRPYFNERLRVVVPSQQEELAIPLRGRCWEEGTFLVGFEYPPPTEDPFMEQQLARMVAAAAVAAVAPPTPPRGGGTPGKGARAAAAAMASGAPASPPRQLVLSLPGSIYLGETASATFQVGSLKGAAAGGAMGELVLDDLPLAAKQAGWSFDMPRVSVPPGELKNVVVKYVAPAKVHAGLAAYFGHQEHVELTIGATLTGGLPAPPAPEGRRLQLRFRCLLLPGTRPFVPGQTPPLAKGTRAAVARK